MRLNIQPTSDGDGPIEDTFKVTSESGVYLMNAIMVVVVTYLAAFRSLNVSSHCFSVLRLYTDPSFR